MKGIISIQDRLGTFLKGIRDGLSAKQVRMLRLMPRMVIFMVLCVFFSLFITSIEDLVWFMGGVIVFALFLFFVPIGKLIKK